MAKKVKKVNKEVQEALETGMYKGYSLSWLRKETEHPDHYLVAEFDALAPKGDENE